MTRLYDFVPLPPLSDSSKNWTSLLLETADGLAEHCPMPLNEALKLPISFESFYYDSPVWSQRKKALKAEAEKHNTLIKIGNAIIKGLGNIANSN